jgi:hypothetical protein
MGGILSGVGRFRFAAGIVSGTALDIQPSRRISSALMI